MQDVGPGSGPAGAFDDFGDGFVLGPARAGGEEVRVVVPARVRCARRIAFLTKDQPWPEIAPEGIAMFTGAPPSPGLVASLARLGLTNIVSYRI